MDETSVQSATKDILHGKGFSMVLLSVMLVLEALGRRNIVTHELDAARATSLPNKEFSYAASNLDVY